MKIFTLNSKCLITQVESAELAALNEEVKLLNEFSKEVSELNALAFNPSENSIKKIIDKLSASSLEVIN